MKMVLEEVVGNETSLSNMILGFFEDVETERWPESGGDDDNDEGSSGGGANESKAFWQNQHSKLHEALAKISSAESRIRVDTEAAMQTVSSAAVACSCTRRAAATAGDCRNCMLRNVAERLRDAGHNSALCKSKWTRSPDIPSG